MITLSNLFSNHDMTKVNLQLSWFSQFQFAGYYIAKEKGFYKDENIDINIKPFAFGINVPQEVSLGKSHFGIGRETLILEKLHNYKNLVSIYPLFQISPLILLSKNDSNITQVTDFKNKKLMATIDDANEVSLKAMIQSNGVDLKTIQFYKHSHNIDDLITNKVDIISAYSSKAPHILNEKNIQYNIFAPHDYGFDMYSDFLFTNEKFVNENSHLTGAFKRASLKGWKYAYENIEESVDLILNKYNTQNLTKKELLFEAIELKKLSMGKDLTLGKIDKIKLMRILDLYRLMGIAKQSDHRSFNNFIFKEDSINLTQEENYYLRNKDVLKMCIKRDHMPYESINNNHLEGIVSEYKILLEKKLDIDIQIVVTDNRMETISYLQEGRCDMISFAGNINSRDKIINFTDSYINLPYVAIAKKDQTFISNFTQLENFKVVTSNCKVLNQTIEQNYPLIQKTKVYSFEQGFSRIEENDADFFIANIADVAYFMKDYYSPDIHIAGRFNEALQLSFALNKGNETLLSILNKTVQNISKAEHDEALSKFTTLQYKKVIDYSFTIKIVIFSLFIIILLLFFYRREKNLKNKISKLNQNLEYKITKEVNKNREKDQYLFQQSKLASMGEMIGNIAHQWRQPLNRIGLSSQIIHTLVEDKETTNNEQIKRKIDHINKNIHYMSDTIEDFMNYFHPDKEKKVFLIHDSFMKALQLLKTRTSDITINLKVNEELQINGYENEFTQIILVILNNALDNYEITKVDNFIIDIFIEENNNYYTILIKDNGGGIEAKTIDKIFEPYFTTKFQKEGSGIGLYMAKMILEQSMQSSIDVRSYGNITIFEIQLNKG